MSLQSLAVAPSLLTTAPRTRPAPSWSPASVRAAGSGLVLVALAAVQIAATVVGTLGWVVETPPAFGAIPLLALAVGWIRFRDVRRGPDIHDRQLDRIVSAGAALGAATLLLLSPTATGQRLDLLALPATLVAIIAARFGTRMLWQLRAAPFVLVLAWPTPWTALLTQVSDRLPAGAAPVLLGGALTGAVLALPLVLAARSGRLRRFASVVVAAAAGATASQLVLTVGEPATRAGVPATAALLVGCLMLLTVLLPLRILRPTRAGARA